MLRLQRKRGIRDRVKERSQQACQNSGKVKKKEVYMCAQKTKEKKSFKSDVLSAKRQAQDGELSSSYYLVFCWQK